MAYIRDYASAADSTDQSTHTASMPTHQTDDILLWIIGKDTNAGGDLSTPSGWTNIFHEGSNGQIRSAGFYKVATSSSETAPSTTSSDTDAMCSFMISIADADTADVINGYNAGASTSSFTHTSPAVTTDEDNCLVLYFAASDGTSVVPTTDIGVMFETSNNGGSTVGLGFGWQVKETAGAVTTPGWKFSASDEASLSTIAINHDPGTGIASYQSPANSPATYLASFDLNTYSASDHGFTAATTALTITTIGSKTASYSTTRGSNFAYGCNTYSWSTGYDSGTSADLTACQGLEWAFTSAKNMSSGLLACTFVTNNPEDARAIYAKCADGGIMINIADSSDNYRAWHVYGSDNRPDLVGRVTAVINPSNTSTDYATSATPPTLSDIDTVQILITTAVVGTGGGQVVRTFPSEMHLVGTIMPVGGSSALPMNILDIYACLNSFRCQLGYLSGASSVIAYAPIQIGDGTITTYADIKNSTLQFPRIASVPDKQINYHGNADDVGISYYGVSGDTIIHRNSIISSPSQYFWKIHASATSAATYSFSGLTVIGANVTLRDVTTFDSMSFRGCVAIDASSCDLTNCVISGLSGDGDLTVNGSTTFDTCSFNTTDLAAGDSMTTLSDPSIFTDCAFSGSSSTGHAIEIDTPGTYSLVGNTFTGYGANGTTSAAIYNNSGGAVTLNISGGGSTPTYYNGASASTTVNNTVTVKVTCKAASDLSSIESARVFIEAASGGDLPSYDSVTITRSSTTATVSHTGHGLANGVSVTIRGALEEEYNGVKTITYIDANSYSYTVSGSPSTPATGTITSTAVILNTTTNASGIAQNTGFNYTSDQPIQGRARKASAPTYYKSTRITGSIESTGFNTTLIMVEDA